jgi:hypothetical protein
MNITTQARKMIQGLACVKTEEHIAVVAAMVAYGRKGLVI